MIVRLRCYGSPAGASGDLSRLGFETPSSAGVSASLGLFIEGEASELDEVRWRARSEGLALSFSDRGHHPRACLIGDADTLALSAEKLLGPEAVAPALHALRSDDAPPLAIPGGRLTFERPLVMGILNVTPDSFSDGGSHATVEASVLRALAMTEEGADIIDVGGESTRPGATPVPLDEELRRVVPVIREISARTDAPISVDTMKPEVAREAIKVGARMINDVSGLRSPEMAAAAADAGVPAVLMHMLGDPQTMQRTVSRDSYDDVISDIMWFWEDRMVAAERIGLRREQVVLDPGIGFGKLAEHNMEILQRIMELRCAGRPVLIGASRKGFVTRIAGGTLERRTGGSLAAAAVAAMNGASIIRAHDVPETAGALRFIDALRARSR